MDDAAGEADAKASHIRSPIERFVTRCARPILTALFLAIGLSSGLSPISASAETLTTVHVVSASLTVFRLPLYVAERKGYFKEQGLDVVEVGMQNGSDSIKMLASGTVEFDTGPMIDALNVNAAGIPVRAIFLQASRFTNSLLVVADLADQVHSLADLGDRPIGVSGIGSGIWGAVIFIAKKEGLDPSKLNIVAVGSGAGVIGAIKSKRVAAISYAEPETLQMVADGDAKMLVDFGDPVTHERLVGKDYVGNWMMVLQDYADAHPAEVQKFTNALQQALNWINSHSLDETVALLREFDGFSREDQAILRESVRRQGFPATGVITQSAFDNTMNFLSFAGLVRQKMTIDQLTINKFAAAAAETYPPKHSVP